MTHEAGWPSRNVPRRRLRSSALCVAPRCRSISRARPSCIRHHVPARASAACPSAGRAATSGSARTGARLLQGRPPRPALHELPHLRDYCSRADALATDRARPSRAGPARACADLECNNRLSLHRQSVIYARAGLEFERSTFADWIDSAMFPLSSLAETIGVHARAGPAIHSDYTVVPLLDPRRGKTKTGRPWRVL